MRLSRIPPALIDQGVEIVESLDVDAIVAWHNRNTPFSPDLVRSTYERFATSGEKQRAVSFFINTVKDIDPIKSMIRILLVLTLVLVVVVGSISGVVWLFTR